MLWGGSWEGASCLGKHVRITDFKIKKIKKERKLTNPKLSDGKQIRLFPYQILILLVSLISGGLCFFLMSSVIQADLEHLQSQ